MKVRVTYKTPDMAVDQEFAGATAEQVVTAMRGEVASHLAFALRLFVNAMSPLQFAQEVVKRYAQASKKTLAPPTSCADFLEMGASEGIVQWIER